jgi:hypothetical protein
MKIMHCEDNRAEEQKVFVETADGKFKYQLFMDYAKGLPEEYKLVPIQGNISGGCVDHDDNLLCGLRGGAAMSPFPLTCLIKLDPDGNYIGTFGKGKLGHLHFFEVTDHGTIVILQTNSDYALEMDLKTEEVVRVFGEKDHPSDSGRDMCISDTYRIHNGIFATEPFAGVNGGSYGQMLSHLNTKLAGPFNKPTDVDFDSEGNYYFSDGYGNVAVQKFDKDGNFVKTWGGPGVFDGVTDTPGKFLVPHSICVDKKDQVWVCDREKDAIHVFDTDGNVLFYCSHNMSQPSGVDTDGQYVYVAGRGGYITIFDMDFNIVGQLGFFNGNLRAHHIACDSKGNLYLFPTHANFEHQIIALKRV